jgi:hypothetical protein
MKYLNLIFAFALLITFTSCKKSNNTEPIVNPPTKPVIAAFRDSVSYTIDGKGYSASGINLNDIATGYQDANRKLVVNSFSYALIGHPDSVMYFQKNYLAGKNGNIRIIFLKKYLKSTRGMPGMPGLNNVLKLFTAGKHAVVEDFGWQNTQNGIAIEVPEGTSYNAYNGLKTIVASPGFQKNSIFEITDFALNASRSYNLKAKFTAIILDEAGKQKKLENGYLQLNLVPPYNTLAD